MRWDQRHWRALKPQSSNQLKTIWRWNSKRKIVWLWRGRYTSEKKTVMPYVLMWWKMMSNGERHAYSETASGLFYGWQSIWGLISADLSSKAASLFCSIQLCSSWISTWSNVVSKRVYLTRIDTWLPWLATSSQQRQILSSSVRRIFSSTTTWTVQWETIMLTSTMNKAWALKAFENLFLAHLLCPPPLSATNSFKASAKSRMSLPKNYSRSSLI